MVELLRKAMALCFIEMGILLFAMLAGIEAKEIFKGISYGPMPCRSFHCPINQDDFMSEPAKSMWGPRGRDDLKVIKQLGANHVRLYGNNPSNDHQSFLNEAHGLGLGVVVGISDWPYTQMKGSCITTGYDCFEQVKTAYLGNLQNGFLTEESTYHPALKQVIAINEPDLKIPGMFAPELFVKAVISGIDGMISAEEEANVTGDLVNLTATFSFGVCGLCRGVNHLNNRFPAIGQMIQLRNGMLQPEVYGYTPKNDLAKAYRTRFINSFNTANPADDVQTFFLQYYEVAFPSTPVVIQEYHSPGRNQVEDLRQVLSIAQNSSLLQGISFFEFQVRYDKGGSEMAFGMFSLGNLPITGFHYFGTDFHSWCLVPTHDIDTGMSMPAAVATAFGGKGPDYQMLCVPDPKKVKLSQAGYLEIAVQHSPQRMAQFAARVAEHLGGIVPEIQALELEAFAEEYSGHKAKSFAGMVSHIAEHRPSWANWNFSTACVADRLSDTGSVGMSIGWACGNQPLLDCDAIPAECLHSVWDTADYVFGAYYLLAGSESPLEQCYFNGNALFAAAPAYLHKQQPASRPQCVPTEPPPPRTTTTTTTTITTTTKRPFSGDCSFAVPPPLDYFWDTNCVRDGGGLGCNADGSHLACRWCGFGAMVACPTLLPTTAATQTTEASSGQTAALRGGLQR